MFVSITVLRTLHKYQCIFIPCFDRFFGGCSQSSKNFLQYAMYCNAQTNRNFSSPIVLVSFQIEKLTKTFV